MAKIKVAIIGSDNIGTDLMIKIACRRHSKWVRSSASIQRAIRSTS